MSKLCETESRALTSILSPQAGRGGSNHDRREENLGLKVNDEVAHQQTDCGEQKPNE